MKPAAALVPACILLPLLTSMADAQQCKTEIDNVTKLLASRDAGSGPTAGASGTQQPMSGGPSSAQAGRQEHPPTATVGEALGGGAASPQDVQAQTRGEPTAAQKAQGAKRPEGEKLASAQAALARAHDFERSGKEAECMSAVAEAKQLIQ